MRPDGRSVETLRPLQLLPHTNAYAEGSVTITLGGTTVLCTATVENKVPAFLRGKGQGWVHAEYAMLPRATHERTVREATRGKLGGRTLEIQRLIGRSLRAVTNLEALGPRTIVVDCDVLQADGSTRTVATTGAFVAFALAVHRLACDGVSFVSYPIEAYLAAVSVGVVRGQTMVDLTYAEDHTADVDVNVVMTGGGDLVEVQGTGERTTFSRTQLLSMLDCAHAAIAQLVTAQGEVLGGAGTKIGTKEQRQ